MTKFVKHSVGRTMFRTMLISMTIIANSARYTTDTTGQTTWIITDADGPSVRPSSSEGILGNFAPTDATQKTSPFSTAMVETSMLTSQKDFVTSYQRSHQTEDVQDFLSELTTITFNYISTETVSMETGGWQWEFSWDWNIIMQLILSLVGVFGNLLVVIVLITRKFTSNSTDILIMALTVSDLLTSICNIPIPQASQLPASILGALYCRIIHYKYHTWVCVITSSFILMALSVERLVAVYRPLHFRKIFTNRRVYIFILLTWLFSLLSCSYYFIDIKAMLQESFSNERNCEASASVPARIKALKVFTVINFVIRLVIPTVVMIITQIAMASILHLKSRHLHGPGSQQSGQSYHIVARNRIIKIMLIVVVVFILCWAPSQITWVIISFQGSAKDYSLSTLRQILNLATFFNSSINPFIYTSQYPKFRSALKDILIGKTQKNAPMFGSN
ncbi:gastrin/cholecystokinin type B receptor-like [Strongylocentrotus purpuratus]|uniref:G-protein coupled receptors family 1 profile domain-containing protein n=1 Tax=Strongylocentrotus purpuratus TaxID=7668 RepID=A0A7M7HIH3_STRPU|nr:gastrin/cholecystokinin type B receptor-like [Strongylocentrotus purpuratus]